MSLPWLYPLLFILGLIAGSFLGMLTYRLPMSLAITGRSFCDFCKRKIAWSENIPLLAYLFLRKCKTCENPIPFRYPAIEVLTGTLFVLTALFFVNNAQSQFLADLYSFLNLVTLPYLLVVVFVSLALAVIDFEKKILPDVLVCLLGFFVFGLVFVYPGQQLFEHLLWGYLSFLFFLVVYLVTKGRGMGFGDVKLVFVLGSFLGFPYLFVWLFLAFFLGAVAGLVLLAARKAKFGKEIPFGPFLLFSFWASIFYGDKIINWYLEFSFK